MVNLFIVGEYHCLYSNGSNYV